MPRRPGLRTGALAAVAMTVMVCGFAAAPPAGRTQAPERLLAAARPAPQSVVGTLLRGGLDSGHFCTASVVVSPGRNLLITAAHCLYDTNGGGYAKTLDFAPGYHDGKAPYGVWTAERMLVAPQWMKSADPDYDVGFVVLRPLHGRSIQQVVGGNGFGVNPAYRSRVRVTGYPETASSPVTCVNWTARESATQLEFDCGGFADGTSGAPFVTQPAPGSAPGRVIGVIGGYEEGGDTPSQSYSPYFGPAIRQLYQHAAALSETAPGHGHG